MTWLVYDKYDKCVIREISSVDRTDNVQDKIPEFYYINTTPSQGLILRELISLVILLHLASMLYLSLA